MPGPNAAVERQSAPSVGRCGVGTLWFWAECLVIALDWREIGDGVHQLQRLPGSDFSGSGNNFGRPALSNSRRLNNGALR
jgi:hypothetical protein